MIAHPAIGKYGPRSEFHHYFGVYSPKLDKLGRRVDSTSIALHDMLDCSDWNAGAVGKSLDKYLKAEDEYHGELERAFTAKMEDR